MRKVLACSGFSLLNNHVLDSLYLRSEPASLVFIGYLIFVVLRYEGEADVPDPGSIDVDGEGGGVHPTLNGQPQHIARELELEHRTRII